MNFNNNLFNLKNNFINKKYKYYNNKKIKLIIKKSYQFIINNYLKLNGIIKKLKLIFFNTINYKIFNIDKKNKEYIYLLIRIKGNYLYCFFINKKI